MKAPDVLLKAADLVRGERQQEYGDALTSFMRIAQLWNSYLAIRRNPEHPLTAEDVATMMGLFKVSRMQGPAPKADSAVDAAAYFAFAGEIGESGTP